jgi:hypothetical protein
LGVFKIIDKQFTQLFSVHSFIRKHKNLKQIPGCFIFLSGRTESDYWKIYLIRHEKIPEMFCYLKKEINELFQQEYVLLHRKKQEHELVEQFFSHLRVNWIAGIRVWPPFKWVVFNKQVRTNNNAEGWHNRINERTRRK